MSLYGRTDSNTNKTKAGIGVAASSITPTIVFVDETEAQLNENRQRGIDGPGWWSYYTYVDTDGNTRHKSEKMVALADPDTNANETQADDTIAADVASAVTITVQPASATTSSGAASFTLTTTTTGTPGTLAYQWQYQTASQTTKWTNVTNTGIYSGATTNTLAIAGVTDTTYDGYKYRVKITSAGGTEEVISNGAATLTFDD
jgi:Tfp pilus assembly protein PilV